MINFVVCGVPRSGTTALASLLNWHPNIFCGIERFPLSRVDQSYFTPQTVRDPAVSTAHYERNLATLSAKAELQALGDKGPRYFFRLAGYPESFPGIKLIVIIRNITEVFQSWNTRAQNSDDLSWHRGQTGAFAYLDTLQLLHTLQLLENSNDGIVLSYEELFFGEHARQHKIINRIFDFLEVSPSPEAIEKFDSESGKRRSLKSKELTLSQNEYEFIDLIGIDRLTKDLARAGGHVSSKIFSHQSQPLLEDLKNRKNDILYAMDDLLLPDTGFDQAMIVIKHCYQLSAGTNIFNTLKTKNWERAPTIRVLATFYDSLHKNNHKTALEVGDFLLNRFPSRPQLLEEMAEVSGRLGDRKRSQTLKKEAKALKASTEPATAVSEKPVTSQKLSARSKIIRQNLNLAGSGLEIGPLHKPNVLKTEGNIKYLDRLDAQELKEKYRNHPNIPEDDIKEIDFVLVKGDLRLTIPEQLKFDYVIASHVIQLAPNLVLFLQNIDSVLKSGGILSLAVPDKRYCFDTLKEVSTLGEVLTAYHDDIRRPSFFQVFNHMSKVAEISAPEAWSGEVPKPIHGKMKAYQDATESQKPGHYPDVHCWSFTPKSFRDLIRALLEMKFISLGISEIIPTRKGTNEFFVQLRRA